MEHDWLDIIEYSDDYIHSTPLRPRLQGHYLQCCANTPYSLPFLSCPSQILLRSYRPPWLQSDTLYSRYGYYNPYQISLIPTGADLWSITHLGKIGTTLIITNLNPFVPKIESHDPHTLLHRIAHLGYTCHVPRTSHRGSPLIQDIFIVHAFRCMQNTPRILSKSSTSHNTHNIASSFDCYTTAKGMREEVRIAPWQKMWVRRLQCHFTRVLRGQGEK